MNELRHNTTNLRNTFYD